MSRMTENDWARLEKELPGLCMGVPPVCTALWDYDAWKAWVLAGRKRQGIQEPTLKTGLCCHCQERPARYDVMTADEGAAYCHHCETALFNPDPEA